MKRSGTGPFWGGEASWEVVEDVVEGLVTIHVVRITFAGDDRPLWVVCEPGDPPRPLCRHEHLYPGSVLCPEQRAARDELDRLERVRRMHYADLPTVLPPSIGGYLVARLEASGWKASAGGRRKGAA